MKVENKSKPQYKTLNEVDISQFAIIIVESANASALNPLLELYAGADKKVVVLGDLIEGMSSEVEQTIAIEEQDDLFVNYLGEFPISTRFYLVGSEAFLWDIYRLATEAGIADEYIVMMPPETKARRVFCTHCYKSMDGVTESPVECIYCHRPLEVLNHFSKRLSAYIGFEFNAEDRSIEPQPEPLD